MKAADWTKVYKNYKGKWVAVDPKTAQTVPVVVAFGPTLKEAMEKATRKGYDHPLMAQIPKKVYPIVGGYSNFKDTANS